MPDFIEQTFSCGSKSTQIACVVCWVVGRSWILRTVAALTFFVKSEWCENPPGLSSPTRQFSLMKDGLGGGDFSVLNAHCRKHQVGLRVDMTPCVEVPNLWNGRNRSSTYIGIRGTPKLDHGLR